MSIGMVISSIALTVSLLVTIIKFIDWISHSDPRAIVRLGRFGLLVLAVASVPALMTLLALQEWTGAMLLGAAMLLACVLINWRMLVPRARFRPIWVDGDPPGEPQRTYEQPVPDADLARRAAIVLQDYLTHVSEHDAVAHIHGADKTYPRPEPDSGPMSAEEAQAVLGLTGQPTPAQVRAAHRRLMQLVHPDRGGTDYLAMKINRAKDVLAGAKAARTPKASRVTKTGAGRASD